MKSNQKNYEDVLSLVKPQNLAFIPTYDSENAPEGISPYDANQQPHEIYETLNGIMCDISDDNYSAKRVKEINYDQDGFYYDWKGQIYWGIYVYNGEIACAIFVDKDGVEKMRIDDKLYECSNPDEPKLIK